MMRNLLILSIFISSLLTQSAWASSKGTSGGIILKLPVGARVIGMAEAFTGVADDINSIYYNPAGLVNLKKKEIVCSYSDGVLDVNHGFLGYGQKIRKGYAGASISTLQAGDMTVYKEDGSTYKINAGRDYLLSLSYARPVRNGLSLGASLKLLRGELAEEEKATAPMLDLAGLYRPNVPNLSFGLSFLNLGGKLKYKEEGDLLPFTVRLGSSYLYRINKENGLTFAADLIKPNDSSLKFNLGTEYGYKGTFKARLGYKIGYDLEGIACGLGFLHKDYTLDYAYSPVENLESSHRVSVAFRF